MVFRTTTLMGIYANPTQTKLHITKAKLDKFYEFIYGTDLAGRSPPPPLAIMMYAERLAWRKISLLVHEDISLSDAIDEIRQNTLFWQHEVGDKCKWNKPSDEGGGWGNGNSYRERNRPKGKGKGYQKGKYKKPHHNDYHAVQYNYDGHNNDGGGYPNHNGKGKGGKNGKGKDGKGKGGKNKGKGKWVSKTDKGQYYCYPHQHGTCNKGKNCPSSHNCPVDTGSGRGCNKAHYACDHQ